MYIRGVMTKEIVAAFAMFLGSNMATAAQAATAQASCALPAVAASAELKEIPASDLVNAGSGSLVATNPGAPASNALTITIN